MSPLSSRLVAAGIQAQIAKQLAFVDPDVRVAEDNVHLVVGDGFLVLLGHIEAPVGQGEDETFANSGGLRFEGGFSVGRKYVIFGGFDDEEEVFLAVDVLVDAGFVVGVKAIEEIGLFDGPKVVLEDLM